jgi:hypothetical protein
VGQFAAPWGDCAPRVSGRRPPGESSPSANTSRSPAWTPARVEPPLRGEPGRIGATPPSRLAPVRPRLAPASNAKGWRGGSRPSSGAGPVPPAPPRAGHRLALRLGDWPARRPGHRPRGRCPDTGRR